MPNPTPETPDNVNVDALHPDKAIAQALATPSLGHLVRLRDGAVAVLSQRLQNPIDDCVKGFVYEFDGVANVNILEHVWSEGRTFHEGRDSHLDIVGVLDLCHPTNPGFPVMPGMVYTTGFGVTLTLMHWDGDIENGVPLYRSEDGRRRFAPNGSLHIEGENFWPRTPSACHRDLVSPNFFRATPEPEPEPTLPRAHPVQIDPMYLMEAKDRLGPILPLTLDWVANHLTAGTANLQIVGLLRQMTGLSLAESKAVVDFTQLTVAMGLPLPGDQIRT